LAASPASPSSAADAAHAARSGLLQVLMAFGQALLFMTQFVISRLYGAAVYGVYVTSVGILEVLTRAGFFGADKSLLRYVAAHRIAGEPELEERALGSGIRLATGVSALLAVVLVLGAGSIATFQGKPELAGMLRLMAPAIVAAALTRVLAEAMLGAKVVRMNLYVRGLGDPMLLCLCTLVGAALGAGALRLATAHVIAACCTSSLAAAAATHVFGRAKLRRALAAPAHPELVRFAAPMGISEAMNAVLQRADVILLGFFVSREEVGIYAAAEFIGRIIAAIRYAFDSIAGPVLAEALKTGDRRRLRYNLSLMTRWVTLVSAFVSVTVIALRHELLSLYGPLFGAGTGCLVVLALAHLINACLGLVPWVIAMSGRSRLLLGNNFGAAILNVTLNLLLVPVYGILGAALAALLSVTVLQLAFLVETWWLERTHPFTPSLLKVLVAAAVTGLGEHLIAGRLPGGAGLRVATLVVAGGLTYALALVALGLDDEERQVLGRVLRSLGLRT
jgi:O-antigen/teichoic acid export membrane protein